MRPILFATAWIAAVWFAGVGLPPARADAAEATITIDNFAFAPAELDVAAGTSVIWINRDDIPHKVVGADDPRALASPPLDTGDRYAVLFAKPGRYRYFCSLHPHMQGIVVVR